MILFGIISRSLGKMKKKKFNKIKLKIITNQNLTYRAFKISDTRAGSESSFELIVQLLHAIYLHLNLLCIAPLSFRCISNDKLVLENSFQ